MTPLELSDRVIFPSNDIVYSTIVSPELTVAHALAFVQVEVASVASEAGANAIAGEVAFGVEAVASVLANGRFLGAFVDIVAVSSDLVVSCARVRNRFEEFELTNQNTGARFTAHILVF